MIAGKSDAEWTFINADGKEITITIYEDRSKNEFNIFPQHDWEDHTLDVSDELCKFWRQRAFLEGIVFVFKFLNMIILSRSNQLKC